MVLTGKAAARARRFISFCVFAIRKHLKLDENLAFSFDFDVVSRYGFAVRAYDANGNVATPSNVASLVFPIQRLEEPTSTSEPTTAEHTTTGTEEIILPIAIVDSESLPAAVLAVIIIIAVAVVAASVGMFVYFYRKKHRGDAYKV